MRQATARELHVAAREASKLWIKWDRGSLNVAWEQEFWKILFQIMDGEQIHEHHRRDS